MASPYKMKNSMLKMASKGAPMQKNYAGSPLAKNGGDEKVKKGDANIHGKPYTYDTDPAKNQSRSDTVEAGVYQHHFSNPGDDKKFSATVKGGKEAENRLKGHKVTKKEISRQHNTPSFKEFKKRMNLK